MKTYDIPTMKEMRLEGKTLQAIGLHFGLTRERVRQLLTKNYGSSIIVDVKKRVAAEIREYQWDSGSADEELQKIVERIHAIYRPMKVNKDDPLANLIK